MTKREGRFVRYRKFCVDTRITRLDCHWPSERYVCTSSEGNTVSCNVLRCRGVAMSYVLAGRLTNLWLLRPVLTMVHWEEFGNPRCHSSPLLNACARSGKRTSDAKRLTYRLEGYKWVRTGFVFLWKRSRKRWTLRSKSFDPIESIIKIVILLFWSPFRITSIGKLLNLSLSYDRAFSYFGISYLLT